MIQELKSATKMSNHLVRNGFSPVVKDNSTTTTIKQMIKESIDSHSKTDSSDSYLLDHLNDQVEDPYKLIESYFEGKYLERLVRHQIESYNHFINYQIQRTSKMFNPVKMHSEND